MEDPRASERRDIQGDKIREERKRQEICRSV
jgi:hypothetical protein